ncbi:hypothetical protein PHJA_002972800, partial [Phtheirospermum japonicum]
TVYVVNALPNNSSLLDLHCASGSHELGYHTISPGQQFIFDVSSWFRTLYFCHLWWGNKDVAFVVYNAKYDPTICYWEARSDGIYLAKSDPPQASTKEYSW